MLAIEKAAQQQQLTPAEWARRTLIAAEADQKQADMRVKLSAVRKAAELSFPTASIEQILAEIEQGYWR